MNDKVIKANALRHKIKSFAKEKNIHPSVAWRLFVMERFLERVSLSPYRELFILKGGTLVASMVGAESRNTKDLDITIKSAYLTKSEAVDYVQAILNTPMEEPDGFLFSYLDAEEIREETGYRIRLRIRYEHGKMDEIIKIDITIGDTITPQAEDYAFPLMLSTRTISLRAYNVESVLAEKINAILKWGADGTRMKDYYDTYLLPKVRQIDFALLRKATDNTATQRGMTDNLHEDKVEYTLTSVANSQSLRREWKRYQRDNSYAEDITWTEVVTNLQEVLKLMGIIGPDYRLPD